MSSHLFRFLYTLVYATSNLPLLSQHCTTSFFSLKIQCFFQYSSTSFPTSKWRLRRQLWKMISITLDNTSVTAKVNKNASATKSAWHMASEMQQMRDRDEQGGMKPRKPSVTWQNLTVKGISSDATFQLPRGSCASRTARPPRLPLGRTERVGDDRAEHSGDPSCRSLEHKRGLNLVYYPLRLGGICLCGERIQKQVPC